MQQTKSSFEIGSSCRHRTGVTTSLDTKIERRTTLDSGFEWFRTTFYTLERFGLIKQF